MSPNLAQLPTPGEKATINNRTNIKAIVMPKWIKPQIINPQSFILSHQTLTTFKIPI